MKGIPHPAIDNNVVVDNDIIVDNNLDDDEVPTLLNLDKEDLHETGALVGGSCL
jgi:hypothetical protein